MNNDPSINPPITQHPWIDNHHVQPQQWDTIMPQGLQDASPMSIQCSGVDDFMPQPVSTPVIQQAPRPLRNKCIANGN